MAPMKAKNPLLTLLLLMLIILPGACAQPADDSTTATTVVGSTATTPNPFAEAVRAVPAPLPASVVTIVIQIEGESWVVPAAVCLHADGDADVVLEEARRQVAVVHSLVAPKISGWPTTTWNPLLTEEAQAEWRGDLRVAGVTAMALAGLLGKQAALEQAWNDYEQSFADPQGGWDGPTHISGRTAEWKAEAQALTQAITARCSGE